MCLLRKLGNAPAPNSNVGTSQLLRWHDAHLSDTKFDCRGCQNISNEDVRTYSTTTNSRVCTVTESIAAAGFCTALYNFANQLGRIQTLCHVLYYRHCITRK